MSLSAGQRTAELSPSRLAIVLFVDCFEAVPALRSCAAFWACAVPFVSAADRAPDLFAALRRHLPADALAPYVPALAARLLNADKLAAVVQDVAQRVRDGALAVQPRSFVGFLCSDQAALLGMLDLYGATAVWRALLADFEPFARALGHDVAAQSRQLLGPASAPPPPRPQDPMWHLEQRDVAATLDSFYRALDLHERRAGAPSRAKTQELSIILESFGFVGAALTAQAQAFASERRTLVVQSSDAGAPRVTATALAEMRGMVSWLHHTLAFHGRLARVPPELDLPLAQIQDYLRHTAATADERAEIASIDMNEALDSAASAPALLALAVQMMELYAAHWLARTTLVRNCTFHLLLSIMWFRIGRLHAAQCHLARAFALARGCAVASLKSHLLSELAYCVGFEFGDPVEGLRMLGEASTDKRFDEGVLLTRSLLVASLYIAAHNFAAAQNALDELENVTLNKFQLRTKRALQVRLMIYTGNYYPAFLHAFACIDDLIEEERQGYQALWLRLLALRALVQSQDPLYAIEARCWLSECLLTAQRLGYANLALFAGLLEARLFFNEGDYRSCGALCRALAESARTTPQPMFYCEWQVLNAACTQLMTGVAVELELGPMQNALYTEFGDLSAVPRLARACLRPHITVSASHAVERANPMSDAVLDVLDGRLAPDDFVHAMHASYMQLIELQNRHELPSQATPVPDAAVRELALDQCSLIEPPSDGDDGDDDDGDGAGDASTPPPPEIRLDSPTPDGEPVVREISIPKRMRPVSGSPRKGYKRRSVRLE